MNHNKWIGLFTVFLLFSASSSALADVRVNGYFRKDGTYVSPHYRSDPDGNFYNNWSTIGNVNPYTGELGTKTSPDYFEGTPSYSNEEWSSKESDRFGSLEESYGGTDYTELAIYELEQQKLELQQQYELELEELKNIFEYDQEELKKQTEELQAKNAEWEQYINSLMEELKETTYTPDYEPYESIFETEESQEVDYIANEKVDDNSNYLKSEESDEELYVAPEEDVSEPSSPSKFTWWDKIVDTIKSWFK